MRTRVAGTGDPGTALRIKEWPMSVEPLASAPAAAAGLPPAAGAPEELIQLLTPAGELRIWSSLLGQEAAQIGSGRALAPQDMAFPSYREHGVAWCRGVDPLKLLALFRGGNHGGWDPVEHKFHLYTIVIGSQTLHATGYAMGIQRDGATGGSTSEDGASEDGASEDRGEAVIAY